MCNGYSLVTQETIKMTTQKYYPDQIRYRKMGAKGTIGTSILVKKVFCRKEKKKHHFKPIVFTPLKFQNL